MSFCPRFSGQYSGTLNTFLNRPIRVSELRVLKVEARRLSDVVQRRIFEANQLLEEGEEDPMVNDITDTDTDGEED